ncbi:hypothetical protein BGZ54_004561, partial [Gamsiella multidivaricata]
SEECCRVLMPHHAAQSRPLACVKRHTWVAHLSSRKLKGVMAEFSRSREGCRRTPWILLTQVFWILSTGAKVREALWGETMELEMEFVTPLFPPLAHEVFNDAEDLAALEEADKKGETDKKGKADKKGEADGAHLVLAEWQQEEIDRFVVSSEEQKEEREERALWSNFRRRLHSAILPPSILHEHHDQQLPVDHSESDYTVKI